ncbi:MAG: TonB-dependent receptor [Deltaproteobacteria bacterium]|nr:TonB-dependent receptor [Nannocystaceae bacterium]
MSRPTDPAAAERTPSGGEATPKPSNDDRPARRRVVVKTPPQLTEPDRAGSVITRRELDERLPRSAPDALRGEPGVFVQQTAHGQASPYIRGLTGQQTVMLFDGVRMNTSTFRQGPNQYFFTVDSHTIDHLEVVRGSASTRYGADALGGAILTSPIEPTLERGKRPVTVHSRGSFSTTTADAQLGGRAQLDVGVLGKVGVIGGVGYRDVNQLYSGGRIRAPATNELQTLPPRFAPDGKTQLGTGFKELTGDVRAVAQPNAHNRITVAYYDYRQRDAPRTDYCPEPTAPQNECLTYEKQNRTLVYGKYEHTEGPAAAERVSWTVSYQRQHENRFLRRGDDSSTRRRGLDTVHTIGSTLALETRRFAPASWARVKASYGVDGYFDKVRSDATLTFVDTGTVSKDITQYTDGSKFFTGGAWAIGDAQLSRVVRLRLGGRFAAVWARAPYDGTRGSIAFNRYWLTGVAHAGLTLSPLRWLAFPFSVDQAFRAPNIDDLTSRQATGGGRQYENARLVPEHATLMEAGVRITQPWLELRLFAFQTVLVDHILRTPADRSDCPPQDQVCKSSSFIITLQNNPSASVIRGVDGGIKLYLPYDFGAVATISYARGDGRDPRYGLIPDVPYRSALSRVPPLNGTAEFGWRSSDWGLYLIGALRWARKQTRLWPTDRTDVRIPTGGTPGFVVFDIRAGYRLDPHLLLALVFENVANRAYRHHGSSINGAGRGLLFELQAGF